MRQKLKITKDLQLTDRQAPLSARRLQLSASTQQLQHTDRLQHLQSLRVKQSRQNSLFNLSHTQSFDNLGKTSGAGHNRNPIETFVIANRT